MCIYIIRKYTTQICTYTSYSPFLRRTLIQIGFKFTIMWIRLWWQNYICPGISLVVQWLRFQASSARGHAMWYGRKAKEKRKAEPYSCNNHGDLKDAHSHTHKRCTTGDYCHFTSNLPIWQLQKRGLTEQQRVVFHLIGLSRLKNAITQERKAVQTLHCS